MQKQGLRKCDMKKRNLGKTGLKVTELSLGGLFTSSHGGAFEQSRKAVLKALSHGINYVDTAPLYFDSENVLGKILEGVETPEPLIISTKLGSRPVPFLPQDKDCLMSSVETSLKLLNRDYIDILMVHEPDRPAQYDWWTDPVEFHGPVLELLDELKKDGIIRHTGIGGTTAYELAQIIKTNKFDVVLTAFNYSPLWREAEIEILPEAIKLGMGIVVGSPLQQGALARRYDDEVENGARWLSKPRREQYKKLYTFLDEIGMSLPELGLRFVISNPDISCVLMGPRSEEEVEQNISVVEKGPLPKDILKRLNEIAALVPFRPFEEPFWLPFGMPYKGPGAK
jgi:aryl-alcohol dehydrogenase-like predicted oxidoreductase